jgi:hypothetical protein
VVLPIFDRSCQCIWKGKCKSACCYLLDSGLLLGQQMAILVFARTYYLAIVTCQEKSEEFF